MTDAIPCAGSAMIKNQIRKVVTRAFMLHKVAHYARALAYAPRHPIFCKAYCSYPTWRPFSSARIVMHRTSDVVAFDKILH